MAPLMVLRRLDPARLGGPRPLHVNPAALEVNVSDAERGGLAPPQTGQQAREDESLPSREQPAGSGDELGRFLLGEIGRGALPDLALRVLPDEVAEIASRVRAGQRLRLDRVRIVAAERVADAFHDR